MNIFRASIASCTFVACVCGATYAGPDFFEDNVGEAGSLPGSALPLIGNGAVNKIRGTLASTSPGAGDFEDMYIINITDAVAFRATMELPEPPFPEFDTQLWLFRVGDADDDGLGLLGNNDAPPGGISFPGGSQLLNQSDDGTGIVIKPGLHYLAVTGLGNDPLSPSGPIFEFEPTNPFEISGPDGPGGQQPITGWTGEGQVGHYVIDLQGVSFIPPTCVVECPPRSLLEGEPCEFGNPAPDDTFNGGCNSSNPAGDFYAINCGETICGQSYNDTGFRDTDWYELDTTADSFATVFQLGGQAEFNSVYGRVQNLGGDLTCAEISAFAEAVVTPGCEPIALTTPALDPGLYWFFVGPDFSQIVNCNLPDREPGPDYVFSLECFPQDPPCPWDFNSDDIVGFQDLLELLSNWGPCP